MDVVIRADASATIGHGHVMRCLSLAAALGAAGARCTFVSRPDDGDLRDRIAASGFDQFPIADMSASTMSAVLDAAGMRPDWLVVDHYQLDRSWESALRRDVHKIMAIDDRPRRRHECDVLLDQNIVSDESDQLAAGETNAVVLLGLEYALLQPEYRELRASAKPRSGRVRRILISFGGADRFGLTLGALRAALAHTTADVDVVIASSMRDRAAIESVAAASRRVTIHTDLPTLAPLILAADLGVGAAGSTSWERLCLGLPSIVVTLAENQVPIATALDRLGLAKWIGDAAAAEAAWPAAIAAITAGGLDEAWSRKCLSYVDGKGAARVAAVLTATADTPLRARPADAGDEARLLRWANDPVTRKESFSQRSIGEAEHRERFERRLSDPSTKMFIVETESGAEIGQVRFERHDDEAEVHYAMAPEFRGRRLGVPMLRASLDAFRRAHRDRIVGRVKLSNPASQRIFQALGFDEQHADAETKTYARTN